MNVDAVMMCILPYHRTNIFVRMLQLLEIGDRSSKWNWLLQVQVKHPVGDSARVTGSAF